MGKQCLTKRRIMEDHSNARLTEAAKQLNMFVKHDAERKCLIV